MREATLTPPQPTVTRTFDGRPPPAPRARFRDRLLGPRISFREPRNFGLVPQLAAERFGRVPIHLSKPFDVDTQARLELDYVELARLVEELSGVLVEAGLRPWDRLAIVKSPNYDILALAVAAARIGAIPVTMSARLDGETLAILLERLESPFILTDQQTVDASGLPPSRWRDLASRLIGSVEHGIPLEDLRGGATPPATPRAPDEPFLITHTSSTTGIPKLVEHSTRAASSVVRLESMRWPFGHSTSDLLVSSISCVHLRGSHSMMAPMSRGTSLLWMSEPDDDTVVRLFCKYRPTMVETHPNTYMRWERLCDHPCEPFRSVRIFFNTFDAAHPRTIKRMLGASKARFAVYSQGYGLTEVGVVSFRVYTRGQARRLTTGTNSRNLGWPMLGTRFRIVDPKTQRRLRRGRVGMIQAITKAQSLGFVRQPEKYYSRKHGKWFDTGDYGRRGAWGTLEVLDREIDRIDGVESCIWVEDVLLDRLPELGEVVVVADDAGGPVPILYTNDDEPLDRAAWDAATADLPCRLGDPVQVPESELPRTATVKARRFLLTARIGESGSGTPERSTRLREGA